MIQTHENFIITASEYNTLFSKNEFYPIQKAYTTPHFICLSVRFPGKTVVLYIGRGGKYQGVYIYDKLPPSFLRVQDRFLDYLRKYLVGSKLGKMHLGDIEQVCYFPFKTDHDQNELAFGYKDNFLVFAKREYDQIFTSWNNQIQESHNILKVMEEYIVNEANQQSTDELTIKEYIEEELKKSSGQLVQKKKVKFLERKMKNIKLDLLKVNEWKQIEQELHEDTIVFKDGIKQKFYSHEIKYTSEMNQWQKRDLLFQKIKKLKKAEEILKKRLDETELEFTNVSIGEFEFEVTKEKPIQINWATLNNSKKVNDSKYKVKEFIFKNIHGAIGLDAQSNDYLRGKANKEHYWFHIENYTGSHLLLKTDDLSPLSQDDIRSLATMIRDFSQLSIQEIPIVYSQLKNIKGVKGVQGKVIIKKPKYLRLVEKNWKEIITVLDN